MKGKKRPAQKSGDFPRKKRKLGKGKRPAENATNISFKSRSIVVSSQLEQSQQPTGKRKLTFEALLRHLNHFKPSMRWDGLTGLRELFQDHPHLLIPNLAKLIDGVLGRVIDSDGSVRHALYTFLSFVFSVVSPNHIRTHFSSVIVHVSCGLTHINDRIQLDSLKVFSLLMKHYPSLLPPHAQHLLPLIVGLISRHQCAVSARKVSKSKAVASLVHDPRSKMSKVSSRVEVFTLLCHFLEALIESVYASSESVQLSNPGSSPPIVDVRSQRVLVERDGELLPAHSNLCSFSTSVPHVMPLQQQGLAYQLSASPVEATAIPSPVSSFSQIETSSRVVFPDGSKFIDFAQSLISLLLECWVECAPSQLLPPKSEAMSIPKDMLTLMDTIIRLLCLVLKLATHVNVSDSAIHSNALDATSVSALGALSEKYATSFLKHFMVYFPLCTSSSVNVAQYEKMNLVLCHITTLLSRPEDDSVQKALQSVCLLYSTFGQAVKSTTSSQLALECSKIIAETLPRLVGALDTHKLPDSDLQCVVNGLWAFYNTCHLQSSAKRTLIQSFRSLLASCGTSSRIFSLFLLPWLENLPKLLVDLGHSNPPLSGFVVDTLASAARHIPLAQLEDHLVAIIGPDSMISQLPSATQKRFVELLWLLPTLQPRLLSLVREWVCSGSADTAVAAYLVEVMHHRFVRMTDDRESVVERTSHYLIFMLGVLLGGCNRMEEGAPNSLEESCVLHSAVLTLVECRSDIQQRVKIIETVCECLRSTHFSDQVLELASTTLQATLEDARSLPIDTALACLSLVQCLHESSGVPISGALVQPLSRLCLSMLLAQESSAQFNTAVEACYAVTQQLLITSQELLLSLLDHFVAEIKGATPGSRLRRDVVLSLIALLDSTELNCALRECVSAVQLTASAVTVCFTASEQDLQLRIQLSSTKFYKV